MRRLLRYFFRRRFTRALNKAEWRTATFSAHPEEAATEVARLREHLIVNPPQC